MTRNHRPLAAVASVAIVALGSTLAIPSTTAAADSSAVVPATKSRTVGVGSNPYDVAISQNLGKAFVVLDGAVSVVSLLTQRQLDEFSTNGFHGQNSIALVRRETEGYITNYDKDTVVVFDTETHSVKRQIRVGYGAVDVTKANTPAGQRAYVAFDETNRLIGIQTATKKVVQRVILPHGTQTVATSPGGATVWAGSAYDGHVYVVKTGTGAVSRHIDVRRSGPVTSIAFMPGHRRAWVAGLAGVSVVDTVTGKTVKFLPILSLFTSQRPNMGTIALTASGRHALIEDSTFPDTPGQGQVTVVDTRSYKTVAHVPTGIEPENLAVDRRRNIAYAPNYADDTLTYFRVPH
jgi:YVTN family beta-propeller protein